MGLLDTLANILTREPKARPEYGPMSDALAEQAKGYGVTGGLLNAIDPYILDPMNAPERRWVRQNLAAKSAKDMVAPSAEAMDRIGMAGIFAGPNAKTANLVALKEAENLAAKGADNEAIRQATGWFKGMDGKWRFEIDDSAARLHPMVERGEVRKWGYSDGIPVSDAIVHPQLLAAYPELGTLRTAGEVDQLRALASESGGYGNGKILFRGGDTQDARSTFLHELQHATQEREGFARGGNPTTFAQEMNAELQALREEARKMSYGEVPYDEARMQQLFKAQDEAERIDPITKYRRLAGEIEARDVSSRMNLTPEQRLATPPDLRPDAIVRYGSGPQMSVPPKLGDILKTDTWLLDWVKNRDRFIENSASKNELYHGTSGSGFDTLDAYRSNYGLFGKGGYLTESPSLASSYTKKGSGTNPGVIPGYADIRNPIDMDAPMSAKWKESTLAKEYGADFAGAKTNEDAYRALEEALMDHDIPRYDGAEMMQDALRDMGHDGITHIGGGRVNPNGEKHRVWITFDPEQFKSRFNRGTFDRSNPNFLKSIVPAAAAYGMSEILPYD